MYITHDGGITWTTYSLAGQYGIFDDIAYGSNPDVIHLSGVNGAKFMSSYDGGSTWVQHSTGEAHDLCVKGDVVALSGNDFVGISRDGGMTTTIIRKNSTNGLPTPSYSFLSIEISPNFEQDGLILIGTNTHEVYRSDDGGTTWSWSGTGLPLTDNAAPRNYVDDLLMSPNFGADGTVYAHVWTSGIYKSTDRGNSWSVVVPASQGNAYLFPVR